MKKKTKLQNGFTLIELMIAMAILAFLSIGIYQNTTQSFRLRDTLSRDGDFYNSIRVALDVMGRDITHLYSPISDAFPGEMGKPPAPLPNGQNQNNPYQNNSNNNMANIVSNPTNFWGEVQNQDGFRASRIQGDEKKLSFISNSHIRLYQDSNESDFAKITYALEDDPDPAGGSDVKKLGPKILVKYEDPAFNEERDHSDQEVRYEILHNVKSLKFRYLHGEKDAWNNRWDNSASVDFKNIFPALIEVTIEVLQPKSENTFTITERFRPELPL